ncbi:O-succinylbenzoate synthase [Boudabousia liubingyangii]|uniref:o-succinylbenzoate synthase n=1 Tax=Boudabousia liubingyangii TaxID=1921764 RepID=UPI000939C647|nr:o-succinylbenzoate synthase [Boudabousia liubingyangii]OKL46934.1 O-succinylbenzoate synthase [Boudabousia liubingyangii]
MPNEPKPNDVPKHTEKVTRVEIPVPGALADLGIIRVLAWQTPMRIKFRRITVREGLCLKGPDGWGECSPFWDYGPEESSTWLRSALELAGVTGWGTVGKTNGSKNGSPFKTGVPAARIDAVPLNVTIPVVTPDRAQELIKARPGATCAKVKVADPASTLGQDCERLAAVREALGPGANIRVDANAAWDLETALKTLPELDRAAAGLDYAEQPCAQVADLAVLRRKLDIRIAADESVRRATDPLAVARAEAADVLVLKYQPLGGIRRAAEIIEQAGLPVVISSALDSALGIWAGMRLAASLEQLDGPCGLGTSTLFAGEPAAAPIVVQNCALPVDQARPTFDGVPVVGLGEGQGPAAGEGLMTDAVLAPALDLRQRWEQRLTQMLTYLAE